MLSVRSYDLPQCPPNGQGEHDNNTYFKSSELHEGITALLALAILDNIQEQQNSRPLLEMEHNSAEYLHLLVESLR